MSQKFASTHKSRILTSLKSVILAVVSLPRDVYPRNEGEFNMSTFSFSSVGMEKTSGILECASLISGCSDLSMLANCNHYEFKARFRILTATPVLMRYRKPTWKIASRRTANSACFVSGFLRRLKSTMGIEENEVDIVALLLQKCSVVFGKISRK